MKLEKIKKTYNDYKLELSWGQLEAIVNALAQNHSDPLADELYAEWKWYMDRVPGPGEDEEEIEAQQKAAEGDIGDGDVPIPMPPGSEAGTAPDGTGKEPTLPPDEDGPTDAAIKLGADPNGPPPGAEPGLPEDDFAPEEGAPPQEDTADRRLPEPPPA